MKQPARAQGSIARRIAEYYVFRSPPTACSATGAVVGHACARASTEEMNLHLRDIGKQVPAGKHAVLVLDGAGWHRSRGLKILAKLSLLRLSPYSPDLNPLKTLFSVLKHRHFANSVFERAEYFWTSVDRVRNDYTGRAAEIMKITEKKCAVLKMPSTVSMRDHQVGLVLARWSG